MSHKFLKLLGVEKTVQVSKSAAALGNAEHVIGASRAARSLVA